MPSHLTLRRWQASHARLTDDDMAGSRGSEGEGVSVVVFFVRSTQQQVLHDDGEIGASRRSMAMGRE
jgi:hypothetical protein